MREISTEKDGVQASVWQILVHHQLLSLLQADPKELHEVPVQKLGGQQQLVLQLMESLCRILGEPFHCYHLPIRQYTL
jgi:hypothetical protein